jgi:hypothetical protein
MYLASFLSQNSLIDFTDEPNFMTTLPESFKRRRKRKHFYGKESRNPPALCE